MTIIQAKSENDLTLGRQGENLARQVVFDLSAWEAEYGPGTVELIHQRPGDTSPYPVAAVREGSTLVWTLTATDTAVASSYGSDGHCELRYYVGEVLVKSRTWLTKVVRAMSTPSETAPPEPEQGWVDQVLAAGAAAKASADAAKADADRAAALAAEVSKKAAQTAKDAVQSAQAMEAAQTAQRLAEEAQGAAETARTAAEVAQAAAEQSATDAAGAKQDAETALKSAQDAAAAAAKALADIQTLYQEMQTWARGVIQDVNAAGGAAVQSVQSAGDAQIQRVAEEGTTQTANAKAQADAAAQSASGAAQSAQQAAESAAVYDTVVADVNQLKQDVAAITPDDATVDGKPWTSKHIVDSLCQPFEESGNPVQVYPVENYPLGVKVSWEPVQEGSGDPSPENIRPIKGRDSVTVNRAGKNLLDFSSFANYTNWRMDIATEGEAPTKAGDKGYILPVKHSKTYTISFEFLGDTFPAYLYLVKSINGVSQRYAYITTDKIENKVISFTPADNEIWYLRMGKALYENTFNAQIEKITYIQLELGSTATPYEPYTGDTYNIALPETVYGGTLDAVSGEGGRTWRTITLTGEEKSHIYTKFFYLDLYKDSSFVPEAAVSFTTGKSSHYRYYLYAADCIGVTMDGDSVVYYSNGKYPVSDEGLQEWKAYLAAQYAAGTPVQVCYKLAEPVPFTATGTQPIPALSGVNTIYTDADGVIVTGAEDPKHTITELKNAIISLGGNV